MTSLVPCEIPLSMDFSSNVPLLASRSSRVTLEPSQGPVKWLGPWTSAGARVTFGVTRPFGQETLTEEYVLLLRLFVRRKKEGGNIKIKIGLKVGRQATMIKLLGSTSVHIEICNAEAHQYT